MKIKIKAGSVFHVEGAVAQRLRDQLEVQQRHGRVIEGILTGLVNVPEELLDKNWQTYEGLAEFLASEHS